MCAARSHKVKATETATRYRNGAVTVNRFEHVMLTFPREAFDEWVDIRAFPFLLDLEGRESVQTRRLSAFLPPPTIG
jgi:hypothetical protein